MAEQWPQVPAVSREGDMSLDDVLDALEERGCRPRRSGMGWAACCPVHDDRKPSLSIGEGEGGTPLHAASHPVRSLPTVQRDARGSRGRLRPLAQHHARILRGAVGNPEHDGDGQPIRYDAEPFHSLDAARADGTLRIWCLGVAVDALTLMGEILTVAVFGAPTFDALSRDFVNVNVEGSVVNQLVPFLPSEVDRIIALRNLAPAGAGCLELLRRTPLILA